jgi:hypothetical protein
MKTVNVIYERDQTTQNLPHGNEDARWGCSPTIRPQEHLSDTVTSFSRKSWIVKLQIDILPFLEVRTVDKMFFYFN